MKAFLQALLWLPVQAWIDHKQSTICHSFFSDSSLAYLSESDHLTVYLFQAAHSSVDTQILLTPNMKSKTLWPTLFLLVLLCSKAMEFSPFWHLPQSLLKHLENCVNLKAHLYKQYDSIPKQLISNCLLSSPAHPSEIPSVCLCVHACTHTCVCVCVCVCMCVCLVWGCAG